MSLSPEERDAGIRAAMLEGAFSTAAAAAAITAARVAATRFVPGFAAVPVVPLRVATACILFGVFFTVSGTSHAFHTTRANVRFAEAIETRDAERRQRR